MVKGGAAAAEETAARTGGALLSARRASVTTAPSEDAEYGEEGGAEAVDEAVGELGANPPPPPPVHARKEGTAAGTMEVAPEGSVAKAGWVSTRDPAAAAAACCVRPAGSKRSTGGTSGKASGRRMRSRASVPLENSTSTSAAEGFVHWVDG